MYTFLNKLIIWTIKVILALKSSSWIAVVVGMPLIHDSDLDDVEGCFEDEVDVAWFDDHLNNCLRRNQRES